jgi:hypothetical protein
MDRPLELSSALRMFGSPAEFIQSVSTAIAGRWVNLRRLDGDQQSSEKSKPKYELKESSHVRRPEGK